MSLARILKEEKELEELMFGEKSEPEKKSDPEILQEKEVIPEPVITAPEVDPVIEDPKEDKPKTDWKQRFTNYKASTDITIHKLRTENTALNDRLAKAFSDIQSLTDRVDSLSKKDIFKDIISEEDEDLIGTEAVDILKRATQKMAEESTNPLKEEIRRLKEREEQRERELERERNQDFYRRNFEKPLLRLVPNYKDLNEDPGFLSYLSGADKTTGRTRLDLLRAAESAYDSKRASEFFLEYLDMSTPKKDKVFSEHVGPTSSRASQESLAVDKKQGAKFTIDEINKNYDDHGKGLYRGREKEWRILEAQMDKAFITGNIKY